MKDKVHVATGEFSFKSSDGQDMILKFVMPYEIASQIACKIIDWKNQWAATTTTIEKYSEAEKEFISKLKFKK